MRILLLAATAVLAAAVSAAAAPVPRIAGEACPAGWPADARCVRAVVPETRDAAGDPVGGRSVALFAGVLPARGPVTGPPVLHLAGGPGQAASDEISTWRDAGVRRGRDLVLLDQRGTGRSRPALRCREWGGVVLRHFTHRAPWSLEIAAARAVVRRCAARWRAAGVDLGAYDSPATAGDVADLRRLLGIPEWDLYGVSYGTRAALAVMEYAPEGVRRVVLDSAAPPTERETRASALVSDLDHGIAGLLRACRRDVRCRAAHPRLAADLAAVVRAYDARPWTVRARVGGRLRTLTITGADLQALVWNAVKSTAEIPRVPTLVQALRARDPRVLRGVVLPVVAGGVIPSEATFLGAQLAVDCADGSQGAGPRDRRLLQRPGRWRLALLLASPAYCGAIGVPPLPETYTRPVRSAIPTLILSGGLDPISLPSQAREAAVGLTASQVVTFPAAGHAIADGAPAGSCAARVIRRFLDGAPLPVPAACAAHPDRPAWVG